MNTSLLHLMARNWWLLLLRGIAALLFGIIAFLWPGITLVTLVILFGAYAIADGVFALVTAFRGGSGVSRGWLILIGLLSLAAGITTYFYPGLTAFTLLTFIGVWSIVRGVFEIIGAIQLRREISNEWVLILNGLLSILFGACVLIAPGAGALAVVWLIGAYSIAAGVLMMGLAFRLRRHLPGHEPHEPGHGFTPHPA